MIMSDTFAIIEKSKIKSLPIHVVDGKHYAAWLKSQPPTTKHWLESNNFKASTGSYCLLPSKDGAIAGVVCGVDEKTDLWSIAHLTNALPVQSYHLEGKFTAAIATQLALGWALATYRFTRYKTNTKPFA